MHVVIKSKRSEFRFLEKLAVTDDFIKENVIEFNPELFEL